ncbi:MAG: lipoyl synthase [Thermodesulfobacteriota bacterium]|nr:lipoyl synthase [Thermodesulfobacteriota bacterium]
MTREPCHKGNTDFRLPSWLKRKKDLAGLHDLKVWLRKASLSTVCEEARCPNILECFSRPTATFMIMGDICTRRCCFCSVKKGLPGPIDTNEPARVARAAYELGLDHIVITSPTRDDLEDQGARHFAQTIQEIHSLGKNISVEVLTPDFKGDRDLLDIVLDAKPEVFNHNVETISRLQHSIRPGASFETSLDLLRWAHQSGKNIAVKSGFMVGLGEKEEEIVRLIYELHDAGCDIITIGQYMQPSMHEMRPVKYWPPDKFRQWKDLAKRIPVGYIVSGPLVRSSFQAKQALEGLRTR